MQFSYETFVDAARAAAGRPDATRSVRYLLKQTLSNPAAVAAAIPAQDEDEVLLFEDDTVSIWSCRFQPYVVMPPHEHKMHAHIGVFSGGEKNILFQQEATGLRHIATKVVEPGEVFSIGADGIHAVTADGSKPSHALHVYLGPLMKVQRALFDWETGEKVDFTMENFDKMKRHNSNLPVF